MRIFVVLIFVLAASCTTLPTATKVSDFGKATANVSRIFKESIALNQQLAVLKGNEVNARAYLAGRNIVLIDDPTSHVQAKSVAHIVAALDALGAYGAALKKAADSGVIAELEQASAKLAGAAGNVIAVTSPISAPIVGPATKLVSRTIGFTLGNAYAGEIQAIIVARNDDVKELGKLLIRDLKVIGIALNAQFGTYHRSRVETLQTIRSERVPFSRTNQPRVDRLRLYDDYRRARSEVAQADSAVKVLKGYEATINSMVAAHQALADNKISNEDAVKVFVAFTDDLVALVEAANKQ